MFRLIKYIHDYCSGIMEDIERQQFTAVWSISTLPKQPQPVSKINKPAPIAGYTPQRWKIEPKSIFDYDPLEDEKESISLSFLRDANAKYVWEGYGKRECFKDDRKKLKKEESRSDLFAPEEKEENDFVDGSMVPATSGPSGPRPFVYSPRPFTPIVPAHEVFRPNFVDFNVKAKPFYKS